MSPNYCTKRTLQKVRHTLKFPYFSQDTVTWSRSDGRELSERARFSYDGNMTFTMTIRGVRKGDRGEFLCRANNQLVPSRNNTKEAVLKVNCKSGLCVESGQKVSSFKFFQFNQR